MDILKIYADLQINPRNIVAYRQLAQYYKEHNMLNESQAFEELLKHERYNPNQKQQQNDSENP